jgi:hypothetical protein
MLLVGHRHDLTSRDLLKARDVTLAHIATGANQSDPNVLLSHQKSPFNTGAIANEQQTAQLLSKNRRGFSTMI